MENDLKKISERLQELEKEALLLEPGASLRKQWQEEIIGYTESFMEQLPETDAYRITEDRGQAIHNHPIGDEGMAPKDLMALFAEAVDRPGLNPASGGHLGYIPGGGLYPAALGDYLAAVTNRYAGVFFASPGAVRIENQLIRWMADVVGYGPAATGNLTSGGSLANLVAIVTARDAHGVEGEKVSQSVIYLSEQAHHSVQKAFNYAGLRTAHLRWVPLDTHFRMDVAALERLIEEDREAGLQPFLVIASAGTTDTGAMDPLKAIGEVCRSHQLWFHVDAAYGGFFKLVRELEPLFEGVELSDSLVIDPHKGLFLPYGLGTVLIRDGQQLKTSNSYAANYMQDTLAENQELSPAELGPELSKHFRGLRLWLPLKLLGLKPFIAGLEEKILLCRYFYHSIQQIPGFEVGPEPDLSVCIFRYLPTREPANIFNEKLVQAVKEDGRVFLSSTTINRVFWIRVAVLAFRTHRNTIDQCLTVLKEKAALILADRLNNA